MLKMTIDTIDKLKNSDIDEVNWTILQANWTRLDRKCNRTALTLIEDIKEKKANPSHF